MSTSSKEEDQSLFESKSEAADDSLSLPVGLHATAKADAATGGADTKQSSSSRPKTKTTVTDAGTRTTSTNTTMNSLYFLADSSSSLIYNSGYDLQIVRCLCANQAEKTLFFIAYYIPEMIIDCLEVARASLLRSPRSVKNNKWSPTVAQPELY